MNDKFFPELTRRLEREGIATLAVEKACLPVLAGGKEAMWVQSWGGIILNAETANNPAVNRVYDTVAGISAQVYEYTEAMASAPPLAADGLHDGFRLLTDFNGVVLAGQELGDSWGYKFVTWQRSPDRAAVAHGRYYDGSDRYEAAKMDFACRAGLVQESRQFSNEQLAEVYRCVHETLDSEYPITDQRRKILEQVAEQIEHMGPPPRPSEAVSVGRGETRERAQFSPQAETKHSGLCPDEDGLDELVGQSNQRELDAARELGRAGPDMEF